MDGRRRVNPQAMTPARVHEVAVPMPVHQTFQFQIRR
jgi:hypothetical protein